MAMMGWLSTCSNGVMVMYSPQWCDSYVLLEMVWWLCSSGNGVVIMYP